MKPHAHEDTALSVSYIKDTGDLNKAALASSLAAETYGMEILIPDVQEALRRLSYDCVELDVFGNYKAANQ